MDSVWEALLPQQTWRAGLPTLASHPGQCPEQQVPSGSLAHAGVVWPCRKGTELLGGPGPCLHRSRDSCLWTELVSPHSLARQLPYSPAWHPLPHLQGPRRRVPSTSLEPGGGLCLPLSDNLHAACSVDLEQLRDTHDTCLTGGQPWPPLLSWSRRTAPGALAGAGAAPRGWDHLMDAAAWTWVLGLPPLPRLERPGDICSP